MVDGPTVRPVKIAQTVRMQLSVRKRSVVFSRADWAVLLQACRDGTTDAYAAVGVVLDAVGVTVTNAATGDTLRLRTADWDTFVSRVRQGAFVLGPED